MSEIQKQVIEYRPVLGDIKGGGPVSDAHAALADARVLNAAAIQIMQNNPRAVPDAVVLVGYGQHVMIGHDLNQTPSGHYNDHGAHGVSTADAAIAMAHKRIKEFGREGVVSFNPQNAVERVEGRLQLKDPTGLDKVSQDIGRSARLVELAARQAALYEPRFSDIPVAPVPAVALASAPAEVVIAPEAQKSVLQPSKWKPRMFG